jgi:hypothetical protein
MFLLVLIILCSSLYCRCNGLFIILLALAQSSSSLDELFYFFPAVAGDFFGKDTGKAGGGFVDIGGLKFF